MSRAAVAAQELDFHGIEREQLDDSPHVSRVDFRIARAVQHGHHIQRFQLSWPNHVDRPRSSWHASRGDRLPSGARHRAVVRNATGRALTRAHLPRPTAGMPPAELDVAFPPSVRWLRISDAPEPMPEAKWYGLPRGAAGALVCAWTEPEDSTPRAVSLEALTRHAEPLSPRWRRTHGPRRVRSCGTDMDGGKQVQDTRAMEHTPRIRYSLDGVEYAGPDRQACEAHPARARYDPMRGWPRYIPHTSADAYLSGLDALNLPDSDPSGSPGDWHREATWWTPTYVDTDGAPYRARRWGRRGNEHRRPPEHRRCAMHARRCARWAIRRAGNTHRSTAQRSPRRWSIWRGTPSAQVAIHPTDARSSAG